MRILHNHAANFHQNIFIYAVIDFIFFALTHEQIRRKKTAKNEFLGFIFEFKRKILYKKADITGIWSVNSAQRL